MRQFGAEIAVLVGIAGIPACVRWYVWAMRGRAGFGGWRGWLFLGGLTALLGVVLLGAPVLLLKWRIVEREWRAAVDTVKVVEAERQYASMNRGYFDDLECLAVLRTRCAPGFKGPALVPQGVVPRDIRLGAYERTFYRGRAVAPHDLKDGVSPSSVEGFAYTMRVANSQLARLALCGDSTGRVCYSWDEPPAVHGAQCDPGCRVLKGSSLLRIYLLPRE